MTEFINRHYTMINFKSTKTLFLGFFCLLGASFLSSSYAADESSKKRSGNQLIFCLAQEELTIHQRKYGGPLYRLNQTLINELVSWNDVHLQSKYIKNVCQTYPLSPSVALLKMALIEGKRIFNIDFDEQTGAVSAYQAQEVESFVNRIPMIFFTYIAEIQIMVENPRCFHQKIPELNYFYERFQYLEEHISSEALIEDKDKIENIFKSLQNLDSIIAECKPS